jgi:hypothetical protein
LTTSVKATIANKDTKFAAGDGSICYYYPLVVFDGCLYEAYLHKDDIRVEETNSILVSFFYQSAKYEEETFVVPIVRGCKIFCVNGHRPVE